MNNTLVTRLLILVVVIDVCAMVGCHRSYYRRQADAEARRLVMEKACDPRWDSADGSIAIDPQSRMFNPFSEDHPPIPPDDAASHQLMHQVDCKPGYPHWHANGDTSYVENPEWRAYLPVNEDGQVVLDLERAFQLALLHSPDFQRQRETLYESALTVSIERFGFDTQLFAGVSSFFTLRRGTSNLEVNSRNISLERLGITGTTFVVGLANTILWNFTGPDSQSATTLLDFSIIQPLLRGAGRDRIMEALTQAERTLLANIRQFDRFQRGFYLEIAIGRNAGAGPGANFLGTPGSANSNAGGFYGLLLAQQQIRNQEFNVRQLEAVLEQFREFFKRERLDPFQLKLFESNVYSQQSNLVQQKVNYQTAVDRFKISLGLPPDLDVIIEDDFLDRFELISDEINDRLIAIGVLREQTGGALNAIDDLLPPENDPVLIQESGFGWSDELNDRIQDLKPFVNEALKTLNDIEQIDLVQLDGDFEKLDSVRENRIEYLRKLQAAINAGKIVSDVDPLLYTPDSIPQTSDLKDTIYDTANERSVVNRITTLRDQLNKVNEAIAAVPEIQEGLDAVRLNQFILDNLQETLPEKLSELNNILLELTLLQAQARASSVEIYDVDIDAESATRIARCFRRDLMNARASLVDVWRQIEFAADQLESQFDLILDGSVGNDGDNPFELDLATGRLRGGFRFDAPIVRVSERNQYRRTYIDYQQARRQYYQFEDEISRNLRDIIRNLNQNKVLFELNRRSVQVQIEQIEVTRFELEAPVGLNASTSRLGTSTARNLTDAIIGLNREQNNFLRTWTVYEVLRRNLDFDMGTMQLDVMGTWIDPGEIDNTIGIRTAAIMGIEPDCQFCDLTPIEEVIIYSDSVITEDEIANEADVQVEAPRPNGVTRPREPRSTPEREPQATESPKIDPPPAKRPDDGAKIPSIPDDRDYFRAVPNEPAPRIPVAPQDASTAASDRYSDRPEARQTASNEGVNDKRDDVQIDGARIPTSEAVNANQWIPSSDEIPTDVDAANGFEAMQVNAETEPEKALPPAGAERIPADSASQSTTSAVVEMTPPARPKPFVGSRVPGWDQPSATASTWSRELNSFGNLFDRYRAQQR